MDDPRPIDPVKARQGRFGYRVLAILVCGLLLAAAAWFVAERYGEAIETPDTAQDGGGLTTTPPANPPPAQ